MKKITYLLSIVMLFVGCNPEETTVSPELQTGPVLVQKQITSEI